nr:FMN-binding protein [Polymorphobacter sp.]
MTALPIGLLLNGQAARATTYFTAETVRLALFPGATHFTDRSLVLSKPQMAAIAKASGSRGATPQLVAADAIGPGGKLGTLLIDKVYGKHEFITYALALDPAGAVKGLEIMDYRESYGDEIRLPKWRAQFAGKSSGDPLKIDKQIKNISGATLSCVHVTEGVARLLATYATVLQHA